MTNHEVTLLIRELGQIRFVNKIKLYSFDSWFLFGIAKKVYQGTTITEGQRRYLLVLFTRIKENTYHQPSAKKMKKMWESAMETL